ncbi:phospholipase domain-containing protein, partial [Acinetobacter baumannii]
LVAEPARYTVGAGQELAHPLEAGEADLFVVGPNGFHRRLTGRSDVFAASLLSPGRMAPLLRVENLTDRPQSLALIDEAYGAAPLTLALK